MSSGAHPYTVVYDPDATIEVATAIKSQAELRAIFNAVDKLRELGERLAPPHMKPLQGEGALRELRPRQGSSDWRLLYRRFGSAYVMLAVDRHRNLEAARARAQDRAPRYENYPLEF
jgi:hypothetical protein